MTADALDVGRHARCCGKRYRKLMSTVIYPGPVFGPVRSRRLGKSLGVNLSPADGKICSFDCIYCECGLNDERRPKLKMPSREAVREALEARLIAMSEADDLPEAITYSGNGEPTSHPDFLNIVRDTLALRDKYCPQAKVCLLTNATHLNRDDVFEAVRLIDRPCLKLDTVDADYIRLVDRPNARYDVKEVIERIKALRGRCVVQTMFMQGSFAGQSVDNTTEKYVGPWLEALSQIRPEGVDIYTLARETPVVGLKKAPVETLAQIAARVESLGISAHWYG